MDILTLAPISLHPVVALVLLVILVSLAILRLTRFVTTDSLGDWLIRTPAFRWAKPKEDARRYAMRQVVATEASNPDLTPYAQRYLEDLAERADDQENWVTWQGKLISGLWCPFCVGFWIALAVIALTPLILSVPILGHAWLILLAALGGNYVFAHIGSRLD